MFANYLCLVHFVFRLNFQFDCNIMDVINILVAIAGFGFAIYQFIHQNKENRKQSKDQNNKNWYLSVLVIPQIERINIFFDETVNEIKTLKNQLDEQDLLARTRAQNDSKERIEAFFSPLEASMCSYDSKIQKAISDIELDLQDEVSKIIGDKSIGNSEIERMVMEYKGNLIHVLYHPIKG